MLHATAPIIPGSRKGALVSFDNRNNRSQRSQRSFGTNDEPPVDDVVFNDQWDDSPSDDVVSRATTPRSPLTRSSGTTTNRQSTVPPSPEFSGTAAQIDQLRRNLGRTATTRNQPTQSAPRPSGSSQQPPRRSSPGSPSRSDDAVVSRRPAAESRTRPYTPPSRPQSIVQRDDTSSYAPVAPARRERHTSPPAPAEPEIDQYDDDAVDYGYDDSYAYDDGYEDDFGTYDQPTRPQRARAPRPQFTMPSLPPAIANAPLFSDTTALGIIGLATASLAAMAILVANRVDTLAPSFATHVTASGVFEHFQSESALWRLPLLATMCTLMNIAIAWFVAPIDRFATRFVLVAAIVVQLIAWIALFKIL